MKKHFLIVLAILLIASLVGVSVYFNVKSNKKLNLYKTHCEFIYGHNTTKLNQNILTAQHLYTTKVLAGETRLSTLHQIILQLNEFEKDLNSYMILSSTSSSSSNLAKKYKELSDRRTYLVNKYNEYITRMSGNISIEGSAPQSLYPL